MKKTTKIAALILSAAMAVPLASCGGSDSAFDTAQFDTEYYTQLKDTGAELNVANWGEYISDGTDGAADVIAEFQELTGIKTNYVTYATNEELYAKMKANAADYDIVIPSDYMISKLKDEDMLEKLDFSNIPNYKYIADDYKNLEFDPDNEYSVPYFWGTVGIIYNKNLVDETDFGWDILWNEKYKDNILMFDNPRDAFAIAENILGYSLNTEDETELSNTAELLAKQKPLVQAYVMDEIFDKMGAEEAALAPYYAGDAVTLLTDYDFLDFKIPESGTNMFVDSICIPKGSANKKAAEMFINFLLEPQVGLENVNAVGYSTPNSEVYNLLSDDIINDGISYPSSEFLNTKTEAFKDLANGGDEKMSELWTQIRSE